MKLLLTAQGLNQPAIQGIVLQPLKASSCNCTVNLLVKKRSVSEKDYCLTPLITRITLSDLFNGYGSIVEHASSFRAHHAGREFINNNIIVCSHYNGSAVIPADLEK